MDAKDPEKEHVAQDTVTGAEVADTTIPPSTHTPQKLTELLSPSKNPPGQPARSTPTRHDPTLLTTFAGRAGLGAYTHAPQSFPSSRVISFDESFVTINDLYPKSSIHTLLLPRDPQKQLRHPFEALQDPEFLSSVQQEVKKLRILLAKELQRRFGKYSAKERIRDAAMEKALDEGKEINEASLPPGRDWSQDVISGVHTHPSMSHLHIHVLSIDRHSECMRHRKHYNSFATDFLVDVEEFPLSREEVVRRKTGGWLDRDLVCWRCGRNYKNKFTALKHHLDEEFEEWKKE
ncbi:MAG: hypothetical protein LQ344_005728 [Seirophora lacunosa]|nr:MAG: hypothetical protein LQ344_005728 [Seirophora lacunosa]